MEQVLKESKNKIPFEEYVEEGKKAVADLDNNRWYLGELADGVSKEYGKDIFGEWCEKISLNPNTVMKYRSVFRFYNKIAPKGVFNNVRSKLSWTHFKIALAAPNPLKVLQDTCDRSLTTKQLAKIVYGEKYPKDEFNKLPFKPYFVTSILTGMKSQTARNKSYGFKEGDIVAATSRYFTLLEITKVEKKKLKDFTIEDIEREGFKTKEDFQVAWKQINQNYNPEKEVFVYRFKVREE